jgi:hypothetical protein
VEPGIDLPLSAARAPARPGPKFIAWRQLLPGNREAICLMCWFTLRLMPGQVYQASGLVRPLTGTAASRARVRTITDNP